MKMMSMIQMVQMVLRNQKGQGMAEYGLILALVAGVAIAGFTLMGGNVLTTVNGVSGSITAP
jgi:pilus assembly protein Flp/PilA